MRVASAERGTRPDGRPAAVPTAEDVARGLGPQSPPARTRTTARWLWGRALVISVAVLLSLAFAGTVRADELDDRVRAIAKELRCIVCQGETVADSNAQLSVQMRAIIREKLEAGESREQILDYFVARYGESILVTPPRRGFALGVWVAPVVALLAGLAIVGVVLRGWRRGVAAATPAAQPPPAPRLSGDEERLERELERFRREGAGG